MWALLVTLMSAGLFLTAWRRHGGSLFDFLERQALAFYARLWHRCSWANSAPLPPTGAALLVANHASHADPAFLAAGSPRRLCFLQARECYEVPLLRRLFRRAGCIPVARDGTERAGLRLALRRLQQGEVLCVFPQGDVFPNGSALVVPVKCGAAYLALRSRAPVYPARISGGPRTRNMLRAWFWPSHGVQVRFGPAIDLSAYAERRIDRPLVEEVAALLMKRIAAL